MEVEAPAHHGTTVVAAATKNLKKRSLDEVVPPAFVEEENGAYGVVEMPKRFVVGDHKKHHDKWSARMAYIHAMDVRLTALIESADRSYAALIQRLDAQDAARAAATARQAAGDN